MSRSSVAESQPAGDRRWVLFDGLPGAGKSTLAQRVARRFLWAGTRARWFHEWHRGHPVRPSGDADFTAWLWGTPLEEMAGRVLERWSHPTGEARDGETIVLDGYPFLSTLGTLVLAGADDDEVERCTARLCRVLERHRVEILFLDVGDPTAAFERICLRRGESFRASFLEWFSALPVLDGCEPRPDVFAVLERIDAVLRRAFESVDCRRLRIDAASAGLDSLEEQAAQFLGLPPDRGDSPTDLVPGTYVGTGSRRALLERSQDSVFLVEGATRHRLLGLPDGSYQTTGWPTRVEAHAAGSESSIRIDETWAGGERVVLSMAREAAR